MNTLTQRLAAPLFIGAAALYATDDQETMERKILQGHADPGMYITSTQNYRVMIGVSSGDAVTNPEKYNRLYYEIINSDDAVEAKKVEVIKQIIIDSGNDYVTERFLAEKAGFPVRDTLKKNRVTFRQSIIATDEGLPVYMIDKKFGFFLDFWRAFRHLNAEKVFS